MKSLLRLAVLVTGFLAVSCTPDFRTDGQYPYEHPDTGNTPRIEFSGAQEINADKTGAEFSCSFTANLPWMAESMCEWISITGPDRGTGSSAAVQLNFSVSKNANLQPRSGKIRVKITDDALAYITVNQEKSNPEDLGQEWFVKPGGTGDGSSWEKAMDLGMALEQCGNADKLYLAAGAYTPTQYLGGSSDEFKTFYVSQNVSIYGGFPENPSDGDTADPESYRTVLRGGNHYHTVVLAAPLDEYYQVNLSGIEISGGNNTSTAAGSAKINGASFFTGYAPGVYVAGTRGKMTDCRIVDNNAAQYVAGVYITPGSHLEMERCLVSGNRNAGGYGAGIHNSGTVILRDCIITGNKTDKGSGPALYNYDPLGKLPCYAYLYGCYIAGNVCENKVVGRPGAVYGRESSHTVMANTTVTGNEAGNSPVFFYGTTTHGSDGFIISSTITGNTAAAPGICGGVTQWNSNVSVYNSVISGNTAALDGAVENSAWDTVKADKTDVLSYSVAGDRLFADDTVSGSFDSSTMIGPQHDRVFPLVGTGNPARDQGMDTAQLGAIRSGYIIELDFGELSKDQKGNERTGKVMGAYVGN